MIHVVANCINQIKMDCVKDEIDYVEDKKDCVEDKINHTTYPSANKLKRIAITVQNLIRSLGTEVNADNVDFSAFTAVAKLFVIEAMLSKRFMKSTDIRIQTHIHAIKRYMVDNYPTIYGDLYALRYYSIIKKEHDELRLQNNHNLRRVINEAFPNFFDKEPVVIQKAPSVEIIDYVNAGVFFSGVSATAFLAGFVYCYVLLSSPLFRTV